VRDLSSLLLSAVEVEREDARPRAPPASPRLEPALHRLAAPSLPRQTRGFISRFCRPAPASILGSRSVPPSEYKSRRFSLRPLPLQGGGRNARSLPLMKRSLAHDVGDGYDSNR